MATIYNQVKLATTENINLSLSLQPGVSMIDGVTVVANDRILVKAQTTKSQNGIYTINSSGVWARASDFANASTQAPGGVVFVTQGNTFADTGWILASDGTITVGTSQILFEKFTVNLKIQNEDLPSNIVLRSEKGYPLTIQELDNNFKFLSVGLTQKLNTIDFNAFSIRDRINTLSAADAGLNAFRLQDVEPDINPTPNTIVKRTPSGNVNAVRFFGNLTGVATNADLATFATLAGNVTGTIAIANGGTGANNATQARDNLNTVSKSGDTFTGKVTFPAATNALGSSLRILPKTSNQAVIDNGDVWADNEFLNYKLNNVEQQIARIDSPAFTGVPLAPTQLTSSNNSSIATTAFVKNVKAELIDPVVNSKAPIDSPIFTGAPRVNSSPLTSENSTRIASTEHVHSVFTTRIVDYSTTNQVLAFISSALTNYYTKTGTDSRIANELTNYFTKTELDNRFAQYYTRTQTDSVIANMLASYFTKSEVNNILTQYYTRTQVDGIVSTLNNSIATKASISYVDGLQDKWGSSRKFVQTTTPSGANDGDFWFKV